MTEIFIDVDVSKALSRFRVAQSTLKLAMQDAAQEQEREVTRLLRGTVRTWQHKVDFQSDIDFSAGSVQLLIGTDDKVYHFLDKGTRVRRAIMSPDWRSKTRPGSLQSGSGRGHVVFISRRVKRPGIKARGFTKAVMRVARRTLPEIARKHVKRWARRV